jgi:hypothetical protein
MDQGQRRLISPILSEAELSKAFDHYPTQHTKKPTNISLISLLGCIVSTAMPGINRVRFLQ